LDLCKYNDAVIINVGPIYLISLKYQPILKSVAASLEEVTCLASSRILHFVSFVIETSLSIYSVHKNNKKLDKSSNKLK